MGLALITGAEGRIRTSICADASEEIAIRSAKKIISLFVNAFICGVLIWNHKIRAGLKRPGK
jgi:hypothetical protein